MPRTLAQIYESWLDRQHLRNDGGPGSGNHGHAGVPGVRGGSAPKGTTTTKFKAGSKPGKSAKAVMSHLSQQSTGTTVKVSVGGKSLYTGGGSRGILRYSQEDDIWTDIDTGDIHSSYEIALDVCNKFRNGEKNSAVSVNKNDEPTKPAKMSSEDFTPERRNNALWCQSCDESRAALGSYERECFGKLSAPEQDALYKYTISSYQEMNSALRQSRASKSYHSYTIRDATSAIDKCALQEDVWTERGIDFDGASAFLGLSKVNPSTVSGLVGKEVTEKGFCSTSAAKGTSFGGDVTLNIYCPKGTKAVYTCIHSSYPDENELLLQQGTQFRVTKAELGADQRVYIDLDVIAQNPVILQ